MSSRHFGWSGCDSVVGRSHNLGFDTNSVEGRKLFVGFGIEDSFEMNSFPGYITVRGLCMDCCGVVLVVLDIPDVLDILAVLDIPDLLDILGLFGILDDLVVLGSLGFVGVLAVLDILGFLVVLDTLGFPGMLEMLEMLDFQVVRYELALTMAQDWDLQLGKGLLDQRQVIPDSAGRSVS